MRNMSFKLTEKQFLDGTKTVTRRLGWKFLQAGDRVQGVRKAQGIPKGGHMVKLGVIEIMSVHPVRLDQIIYSDCKREGFPNCTPDEFVKFFCEHMKCLPATIVNRIEFRRVK